jgi:ADP-ribose pyrophosphatase YjhB (NUDIX family)
MAKSASPSQLSDGQGGLTMRPMARTEYVHDPAAPKPNSLVVAASAVVVNADGHLLLHRRSDNAQWSIPGGAMELGESIAQTVVREVREETGLDVEIERLVGIYSHPGYVVAYSNGEVRQQFSICFACRVVGGELATSDESLEVAFFSAEAIPDLPMGDAIRLRIQHFLEQRDQPVIA